MIKLERPIIFFDLETTGIDTAKDRIVEFGAVKLFPDGKIDPRLMRFNPGIPIPAEATAAHGITDNDVAGSPTFIKVARGIFNFFKGCDIGGFNSNKFDIPILAEEMARADIYDFPLPDARFIDVGNIFKKKEERTLSAAVSFYCDRPHEGAHTAKDDTIATMDVFFAQLEKYPDLKAKSIAELSEFSSFDTGERIDITGKFGKNDNGDFIFTFGKHKGTAIKDQPGYVSWMLDPKKSSFSDLTRYNLRKIIDIINPPQAPKLF